MDYTERLRRNRAEKDDFFAEHPQSPIPPDDRESFGGLDYFPPDPEWRVEATVTTHDDPEPVEMDTSDGRTLRYERVVTFAFEFDGEHHALHGYRQQPEDAVFVPFRDRTTGQETYAGGRYMELEVEGDLAEQKTVILDFNLAYSPFCAYSETFSCPLPPEENWLETAVRAGERAPDR